MAELAEGAVNGRVGSHDVWDTEEQAEEWLKVLSSLFGTHNAW